MKPVIETNIGPREETSILAGRVWLIGPGKKKTFVALTGQARKGCYGDRVFGGHALLAIHEGWKHKVKDRRPRGSKEIPVIPFSS